MKKALIAICLSAAATFSFAAPPPTMCSAVYDVAVAVMDGRQAGVERDAMTRVAYEKGVPIVVELIKIAYDIPIAKTDAGKRDITVKFAREVRDVCITNSPRSL